MILSALIGLAFLALLVAVGLIIYARWNYGILEKTGVPVIKPSFFMGSVPDLHLKVQTDEDVRRYKEYGPTWGLYEGRTPIIYTCDPELMRSIFIKDADYFFDRRVDHFGDPRIDEILDYLPGDRWRKMRKMQTVLFSTGKIRQYSQQLSDAAFDFIDYLKNKLDENGTVKIETRSAMDIVSLDGIARVSFGIKLENVEDPNNVFFQALRKLLGDGLEYDWLYSLSMTFPFLHKLAPSFRIDEILFDTFKKIIDNRREENEKEQKQLLDQNSNKVSNNTAPKCRDLADLLADALTKVDTEEYKRLGFTETTILAQALNVTALDMISAIMTMITYYLAMHPEVQQKLYDEIDEVINKKYKGRIDHDTIHDMPYLTACMNESLRLAPPLIRPERVCNKDWVSPDGSLKIKKGTVVMVPLWAAHRNPKFFPNPEKFDPERFMVDSISGCAPGESHPCAYTPFGVSYKACIAMRLGIETLKVNIAIILKNFRIEPRSDTKLECKPGVLYLLQFKPLYLNFISRQVESNN